MRHACASRAHTARGLIQVNPDGLRDWQVAPTESLLGSMECHNVSLNASDMGVGKLIPMEDRVLTPNGWARAGTIKVGDSLVGQNGKPTTVLGVFPQGTSSLFKIVFSDGVSIRAGREHLWLVQTPNHRRRKQRGVVMSTGQLRETGFFDRQGNARWFIPMCAPVEFKSAGRRPLDAWLLGAFLGDGGSTHHNLSFTKLDPLVVTAFSARLPAGVELVSRRGPLRCGHYGITAGGHGIAAPNPFREALRELGLYGKSSLEKFIPECYLRAPIPERLALLQGLCDTDGSPLKGGIEYTSSSLRLANDFTGLAQSLGCTVTRAERIPRYTYKGQRLCGALSYRLNVCFPPGMGGFAHSEKNARWIAPTKFFARRSIRSIEPCGSSEAVCFKVAAPDQLFLIDHFVVTHNTYMTAALLRHYEDPTLVIAPLATLPAWERVLGSMGASATVLNYEQVKKPGSNFGNWVDPRLDNHKLWKWCPQVRSVVFDEVHRCKGDTSQNCELLMGAKRQGLRTYMLSGTPAQSPLDMRALGYALGFYRGDEHENWVSWALANGCTKMPYRDMRFTGNANRSAQQIMAEFHYAIFPKLGIRLRAKDIEGYPETQITAESYQVQDVERMNELFNIMALAVERWKLKGAEYRDLEHPLTKMLRERTLIELLMVPTLMELTVDAVEDGRAVVVFVNFKETIRELHAQLQKVLSQPPAMYHGDLSAQHRSLVVDQFQEDRNPVILVQVDAGGTGLNLHDVTGLRARSVYIVPGFSALNLLQALRRVHRDGAKTKSTQRIVIAAGTAMECVRRNLEKKMNCLDALCDKDMVPENLKIEGMIPA